MTKKQRSEALQACVDIYKAYTYVATLQMGAVVQAAWKVGKKESIKNG